MIPTSTQAKIKTKAKHMKVCDAKLQGPWGLSASCIIEVGYTAGDIVACGVFFIKK